MSRGRGMAVATGLISVAVLSVGCHKHKPTEILDRPALLGSALAGLAGGSAFLVMFRRAVGRKYGLATLRPLAFPLCAAAAAGLAGLVAQALVPWLQLPAGRLGALAELTLTAVPMAAVYLAVLRISAAFDEYDGRVAREAWQLARTSFGRTGVGR